jgi:Asp/Glu/hydantoin racemase
MNEDIAALMIEVHRIRSEALQARRLAIITTDARAVASLNALAEELDARAEELSIRAAELNALDRSAPNQPNH